MNKRTAKIVLSLIETYIVTGKPVSSNIISQVTNVALSPATIRSILHELDEAGYIYQPHTSAGRIPTDKGYRFYVDQVTIRRAKQAEYRKMLNRYHEAMQQNRRIHAALALLLAQLSEAYVVVGGPEGELDQFGASYLAQENSLDQLHVLREVSRFMDHAREHMGQLAQHNHHPPTVYIGTENPIINAEYTSLLVGSTRLGNGKQTIILLLGPKRMPYQRNMTFLNEVTHII